MKNKFKTLGCAFALFMAMPLASCGSFFGSGNKITITSFEAKQDEAGNTVVTVQMADKLEPLVFTIPAEKVGEGIKSISQSTNNKGEVVLTINYVDGKDPSQIIIPNSECNFKDISSVKNEDGSTTITVKVKDKDDLVFTIPADKDVKSIDNVSTNIQDDGTKVITISYIGDIAPTVIEIPTVKSIDFIQSSEDEKYYYITFYYSVGDPHELKFEKPTKGASWISGVGDPLADQGEIGDFYFDKHKTAIYEKTSATNWQLVTELVTPSTTYTVKFDTNGGMFTTGNADITKTLKAGTSFYSNNFNFPGVFKQKEPGVMYKFLGWYTSNDQTDVNATHFTDLTTVNCDITLYAWWE